MFSMLFSPCEECRSYGIECHEVCKELIRYENEMEEICSMIPDDCDDNCSACNFYDCPLCVNEDA